MQNPSQQVAERFVVTEWGCAFVVIDSHTNRLVLTAGDKDERILQAAILNGREESKCKQKVIAIR